MWEKLGNARNLRVSLAFVGSKHIHIAKIEARLEGGIVDTHLLDSHRRGGCGVWLE
jgi:hypothetical protein